MSNLSRDRLLQLIEEAKRKREATAPTTIPQAVNSAFPTEEPKLVESITELTEIDRAQFDTSSTDWAWNTEQTDAHNRAMKGESFVLIGAAGTGKTTTTKWIVEDLVANGYVPMIDLETKYLKAGLPGIVCTSFTRRAVRNLKRAVSGDVSPHCITFHKLLEFEPVYYEIEDPATGDIRKTMRFEPARNKYNRLPATLKTVIVDESSMVSTDLFQKLLEALPDVSKVQFIFIGDLHQLPPVYGQAILGFKLLELPVVELTKIYRQAAMSPIITLAHQIKNGEDIPLVEKLTNETPQGKITLHPWKKALSDFDASVTMSIFLKNLVTSGNYNEEEDIILCPQEKVKNLAFGGLEFNRVIAQALGEKRKAVVYEIIAGFNKHYYAVGDRLLVGREDAIITKIARNSNYLGVRPRPESENLDRWGNYKSAVKQSATDADDDSFLDSFSLKEDNEDRKQEASHSITVELLDSGVEETITTAGEINAAQLAYCLTVHKSQGSEWQRVFFITHQSHVQMWSRELLYTAVTRARKELYCIIEPDRGTTALRRGTLWKAAKSPRIKGDTLAEKAEFFKGKQEEYQTKVTKELTTGNAGSRGKYKGDATTSYRPQAAVAKPPVELPKKPLVDFISQAFMDELNASIAEIWKKATGIFGAAKLGEVPNVNFNCHKRTAIAFASLKQHSISYNPLHCIMGERDQAIKAELLNQIAIHECCHLIAYRYSNDVGHNSGWRMAMQLMGVAADVYANPDILPPSLRYSAIQQVALEDELKQKNADLTEQELPTEGVVK